jgi:hypothetical protein
MITLNYSYRTFWIGIENFYLNFYLLLIFFFLHSFCYMFVKNHLILNFNEILVHLHLVLLNFLLFRSCFALWSIYLINLVYLIYIGNFHIVLFALFPFLCNFNTFRLFVKIISICSFGLYVCCFWILFLSAKANHILYFCDVLFAKNYNICIYFLFFNLRILFNLIRFHEVHLNLNNWYFSAFVIA